MDVVEQHFWDDAAGMMRESFNADWKIEEAYRGANANMHSVEAFLAAADALGARGGLAGAGRADRRAGRRRIARGGVAPPRASPPTSSSCVTTTPTTVPTLSVRTA